MRSAERTRGGRPSALGALRPPYEIGVADASRSAVTWAVVLAMMIALAVSSALAVFLLGGQGAEGGLVEPPISVGSWQIEWSGSVAPPVVEQARQVRALRRVAGGAATLLSMLCLLIVAGLWRQRLVLRQAEHFVHWAVGARRLQAGVRVVGEARWWGAAALVLGAGAVLMMMSLVEGTFPGHASVPPDIGSALILLTVLGVVLVRWESRAASASRHPERGRLWELLGSPPVVGAVGFAVLSGVGLLAFHAPTVGPDALGGSVTDASLAGLAPMEREEAIVSWAEAGSAAGVRIGLASAGASRAAGHRDGATTECGRCFEGGIPMPLKAVRAEVHAVAPDTFVYLGLAVRRGRDFDHALDRGTPSVAIVSQALANRHFERGQPLGRRLRIGESEWLTVVGVVGDRDDIRTRADYAIYVPLAQARPTEIEILGDVISAGAVLADAGRPGAVLGPPRSRADVFAVHLWFRGLLGVIGVAAFLLLGAGLWVSAANEASATRYEVTVRRALGATRHAVWLFYVGFATRRLLGSLMAGAWLSLFLGAGLAEAYGAIPQIDWRVWTGAALWVTATYLLGSGPALLGAAKGPLLPTLDASSC